MTNMTTSMIDGQYIWCLNYVADCRQQACDCWRPQYASCGCDETGVKQLWVMNNN